MDALTSAVRDLYEAFPYPSGSPELRVGFDVRYVLSKSARERPAGRPLRVLDAGCGRGLGLIGAATMQPGVEYTGIDLNRVALAEARREARERELANLSLFEIDVQTLEGLDVPDGGYDVIHSSGVIHHLADPPAALRLLARCLAPHGVLALMVYGRRPGIERVAAALAAALSSEPPIAERLQPARALVRELHTKQPDDEAWRDAAGVSDVEFVDRYLHPCERTYSVDELFELAGSAGLTFLDWTQPEAWRVEGAGDLNARDMFRLAEQVRRPQKLEVYLCRPDTSRRAPAPLGELEAAPLAVNPEVVFEIARRNHFGGSRTERIATRLREEEAVAWAPGPCATAVLAVSEASEPFVARDLLRVLVQAGYTPEQARSALGQLLAREVLYSPHAADLSARLDAGGHDARETEQAASL